MFGHGIKLTQPAETALSKVQNTVLSPMEEALFQAWTHANGIDKPDAPDQNVDLRGLYKNSQGMILPNSQLKQVVDKANATSKLQEILQDRYKQHVQQAAQSKLANYDRGVSSPGLPHPSDVDPNQQQPVGVMNNGIL